VFKVYIRIRAHTRNVSQFCQVAGTYTLLLYLYNTIATLALKVRLVPFLRIV